MHIFETILDWSEIWALFIPLTILFRARLNEPVVRPLSIYLWIALVLNSISTPMYVFHDFLPEWLGNNNLFYNLHSIARIFLFGWFIIQFMPAVFGRIFRILMFAYSGFVLINFIFLQPIWQFSILQFAIESLTLIAISICFSYWIMNSEDATDWIKHPTFLVVMGVMLYASVTFFVFLPIFEMPKELGKSVIWVYKIAYIILCVILALSFHKWNRYKPGQKIQAQARMRTTTYNGRVST